MKLFTNLKLAAFVAVVATTALAFGVNTPTAVAQDAPEQTQTQEEQQPESTTTYTYIAQPGDSYSLMARKAVQTYGIVHDVSLSPAAIIFAETNLTQAAGSPYLAEGQEVAIGEADVQQWVEAAQNLSQDQLAAWAYYAQFADFNTDTVGEVRE